MVGFNSPRCISYCPRPKGTPKPDGRYSCMYDAYYTVWPPKTVEIGCRTLLTFARWRDQTLLITCISCYKNHRFLKLQVQKWKKRSERRKQFFCKHCARAGCSKVRTPPARPLSQTQTGPITIHCAAGRLRPVCLYQIWSGWLFSFKSY